MCINTNNNFDLPIFWYFIKIEKINYFNFLLDILEKSMNCDIKHCVNCYFLFLEQNEKIPV